MHSLVTALNNTATNIHRRELLLDIEITQMEALLAYQAAKQPWNPWTRYKLRKEANAIHAKADAMLNEYRNVYMQKEVNS